MDKKIEVFICYAHKDELLRQELEKQLRVLQRQGLITLWHNRHISPGADWGREIDTYLDRAHLILLLVSPDFMDSDYCYGIEMKRAMDRHERGLTKVIPIILRPVRDSGQVEHCICRTRHRITRLFCEPAIIQHVSHALSSIGG